MITKLVFMRDTGYLTRMLLSGTKETEYGFFISWKEGVKKDTAYKKVMIQSVYKNRNGELMGNFKRGKARLDNVLIHPEFVPDIVEALAKIFNEHYGVNLLGQPAEKTVEESAVKTKEPIPEKKESLDDRLAKLGRVK